jgi:hypothetical protein
MKTQLSLCDALLAIAVAVSLESAHAADPVTQPEDPYMVKAVYNFTLTRGKSQPVCEAYLKRLNTTEFTSPPFCDIPEDDSVPGFEKLNRVPLTQAEVETLYPQVFGFTQSGEAAVNVPGWPASDAWKWFGNFWRAWRYLPPISFENNNKSEDIVIWQAPGPASWEAHCGDVIREGPGQTLVMWQIQQLAFVLTDDHRGVDGIKTRLFFGNGAKPRTSKDHQRVPPVGAFSPLRDTMNIFEFNGTYYLAGFDNGTFGPYEATALGNPALSGSLAVFLHKNGQTKQVCEYQMIGKQLAKPRAE